MRITIETHDVRLVERVRAMMPEGSRLHVQPAVDGGTVPSPMTGPSTNGDADPFVSGLTSRQRDILKLLALGLSNKMIGRELSLSHFTVRNHISQIMRLLGVSSRTEVVARVGGLAVDV